MLFLPPYSSPYLNPIDEAFSKIKGLLRKAQSHTREALIGAMGAAISAVTAWDAEASSSTAVTAKWVNCYDRRCRRGHYTIRRSPTLTFTAFDSP